MTRLMRELEPFNHWFLERLIAISLLLLFIYIFITSTLTFSMFYLLKVVIFLHINSGLKIILKDYVTDNRVRVVYTILVYTIVLKLFFLV